MKQETINQLSKLVSQMKYSEWCRVVHAIEQKFTSEISKVELTDSEAVQRVLNLEFNGSFRDNLNT